MTSKTIYALMVASLIMIGGMKAYAADDQGSKDEDTVMGACMTQGFTEKMPSLTEAKIIECSNAELKDMPKCLGMPEADFSNIVTFCHSQLTNAKCVASKLKVTLYQYANCGYEKDPEACYKGLGSSMSDIVKLSGQCADEGSK